MVIERSWSVIRLLAIRKLLVDDRDPEIEIRFYLKKEKDILMGMTLIEADFWKSFDFITQMRNFDKLILAIIIMVCI